MSVADRVRELVLPLLAERQLDLYDVELAGQVVRVAVEGADKLDLDVLSEASRAISRTLDEADPISGRYTLEVTSPGLERNLRTPEHFGGAVGETVKIKTEPDVEGDRRVEGVLDSAGPAGIAVRTGGDESGEPALRRLAYDEIARARTVFHWGPEANRAPAGARSGGRPRAAGTSDEKRERRS